MNQCHSISNVQSSKIRNVKCITSRYDVQVIELRSEVPNNTHFVCIPFRGATKNSIKRFDFELLLVVMKPSELIPSIHLSGWKYYLSQQIKTTTTTTHSCFVHFQSLSVLSVSQYLSSSYGWLACVPSANRYRFSKQSSFRCFVPHEIRAENGNKM